LTNVLISTDDLTVIGGPASIDVALDFGSTGDRGSKIFVGSGNPNNPSTVIGQTPQLLDMYINILSSDEEYSYMYQYQNIVSGNTWVKLVKLMPNTYSDKINNVSFVNGEWTTNLPIVGLSTNTIISPENLNVQYSISGGTNPIASSITFGNLVRDNGLITLPVIINAKEFVEGDWVSPLAGKSISLFITVV
jgi:hypothetical protein